MTRYLTLPLTLALACLLPVLGSEALAAPRAARKAPALPVTDAERKASIRMTLTAPGCGMGPTIAADAQTQCRHAVEAADGTAGEQQLQGIECAGGKDHPLGSQDEIGRAHV